MRFDNVVEMKKPDSYSQFLLKPCECGSSEVVYLHCRDPYGNLFWRVRCMDCGAETIGKYAVQHGAQLGWNGRDNILKPGAGEASASN